MFAGCGSAAVWTWLPNDSTRDLYWSEMFAGRGSAAVWTWLPNDSTRDLYWSEMFAGFGSAAVWTWLPNDSTRDLYWSEMFASCGSAAVWTWLPNDSCFALQLVYPSQAHVELQVATSDLKLNDLPDTLVKFKDMWVSSAELVEMDFLPSDLIHP